MDLPLFASEMSNLRELQLNQNVFTGSFPDPGPHTNEVETVVISYEDR